MVHRYMTWLRGVDWKGHYGHRQSRIALLREYFRRSALWAQHAGVERGSPLFDVARALGRPVPPLRYDLGLPQSGLHPLVRSAVEWILAFEVTGGVGDADLPHPFLPLLYFFERGGGFWSHHGRIEVDRATLPPADVAALVQASPFVELTEPEWGLDLPPGCDEDRELLDRLDGVDHGRRAAPAQLPPPRAAERVRFEGHTGAVRALVFSPDGQVVVSGSDDGTVRVWERAGGAPPRVLSTEPGHGVHALRIGDDRTILARTNDGDAWSWTAGGLPGGATAARWRTAHHTDGEADIVAIDASRDGTTQLGAVTNGHVLAWHRDEDAPRVEHIGVGLIVGVTCSRDARRVVTVFARGAWVFDDGNERVTRRIEQPEGRGHTHLGRLSPDGRLLATAAGEVVDILDVDNAERVATFQHADGVTSLRWVADGAELLVAAGDGVVRRWERARNAVVEALLHEYPVMDAARVSRGGGWIAQTIEGVVFHWPPGEAAPIPHGDADRMAVSMAADPYGERVAIGYHDGRVELVRLAEADDARTRAEAPAHPEPSTPRRAPHPLESRAIRWLVTGKPEAPYCARVDGQWWMILVNDFPAEALYSLRAQDGTLTDLESWPPAWIRPEPD